MKSQEPTPPRLGYRILSWIYDEHLCDEVYGDLLEMYSDRVRLRGKFLATVFYFIDVLMSARNMDLKTRKKQSHRGATMGMLLSYFKVGTRSMVRNKTYAILNVMGLALGIASSILILLWVQNEYSYDHFVPNYRQLYKVMVNATYNGEIHTEEEASIPIYHELKDSDSRIRNVCFGGTTYGHTLTFRDKVFNREGMIVSEEFLEMFDIPLIRGSAKTALDEPNSILLNESTAREIFGDQDPINQMIQWDNDKELKVTGVFKDVPRNSTYWFHVLVPVSFYEEAERESNTKSKDWNSFYYRVYVELMPDVDAAEVDDRIRNVVKGHVKDGTNRELFLHPMDHWYLYDTFINGKEAGGKIEYVRLFTWIAVLTLAVACINYMNLATARSERRAREVGIRKTIGSQRRELIIQFLTESLIITFISFVLAVVIAKLCLPAYNLLLGSRLEIPFNSPLFWECAVGLLLATAFFSGFYPAFFFSSFTPLKALKGNAVTGRGAGASRNVLVTIQYIFSVLMIVGVLVINFQISHVRDRDLGYEQEHLVLFAHSDEIGKNYQVTKNELMNTGVVASVTRSIPAIDNVGHDFVDWSGKSTEDKILFSSVGADYDYVKTHRMRILEGRDFSEAFVSDSNAVLVNKAAVKLMGFKNPVGERIRFWDNREWTIIGVVNDVVMGSPFDAIEPGYICMSRRFSHLTVRMAAHADWANNVKRVEEIVSRLNPLSTGGQAEAMFLDERFEDKYQTINLIEKLADLFATLAIAITILGVLGLAAFKVEQRTRELMIRKVLGATVNQLIRLLTGSFLRIVLMALAIATPLAWWGLEQYLRNYSYRVEIPWWTIPMTGLFILLITVVIVISQTVGVAFSNPVKSLNNNE